MDRRQTSWNSVGTCDAEYVAESSETMLETVDVRSCAGSGFGEDQLAIGVAQKEGAVRTETILEDVRSAAQRALEDLRDVARGIYPPLLADKGPAAALEAPSSLLGFI